VSAHQAFRALPIVGGRVDATSGDRGTRRLQASWAFYRYASLQLTPIPLLGNDMWYQKSKKKKEKRKKKLKALPTIYRATQTTNVVLVELIPG